MEYIYLGKISNTHGLKGEVKIISDFSRKDLVFKPCFKLYIGENYQEEVIATYRVHQIYDMVTFKGINNIDEVLKYKGKNVYIKRENLELKEEDILVNDLIGYKICKDNLCYGVVKDIYKTKTGILLYVDSTKNYYIPYIEDFINKIDKDKKEITVERVRELL